MAVVQPGKLLKMLDELLFQAGIQPEVLAMDARHNMVSRCLASGHLDPSHPRHLDPFSAINLAPLFLHFPGPGSYSA